MQSVNLNGAQTMQRRLRNARMARDLLPSNRQPSVSKAEIVRHPSVRGLYLHWYELFEKRGRQVPERCDVEPASLHRWLGDVFVLDRGEDGGLRYRLAGSRACAIFGRELAGRPFLPGRHSSSTTLRRHAERLGSNSRALVANETLTSARGESVESELLLLPLLHDGAPDRRLLGLRTPLNEPSWLGLVPITSVEVEGLRIIHPQEERSLLRDRVLPLPRPRSSFAGARKVAHLTVLDGGKPALVTQT